MAGNADLGAAKRNKNDEFYTQYSDIIMCIEIFFNCFVV